jgi:hypothetical protein
MNDLCQPNEPAIRVNTLAYARGFINACALERRGSIMDATFVDRAINVMEVISWTAIIIAMGLILLVIAASIYASLCIAQ